MLGAAAAGGGAYAFGVEPTWLRTVEREIALPRLDPAFDGYTVVQLSDLHVGGAIPVSFLRHAVAEAAAREPDLVVVTGDLLDNGGGPGWVEEAIDILSRLRWRDAAFAVLGNHDTGCLAVGQRPSDEAPARLHGGLAEIGVDLLRNEERWIERGGGKLRVAGFGDLWSGQFRGAGVARTDACTLALSHNPDTAPELAGRGADLILAGHTHGGQVNLPLFGPPYVPVRHKEFLRGHHRVGDAQLYVNCGLGASRRVRFGARPELTVFRLTAEHGP